MPNGRVTTCRDRAVTTSRNDEGRRPRGPYSAVSNLRTVNHGRNRRNREPSQWTDETPSRTVLGSVLTGRATRGLRRRSEQ